MLTAKKKEKIIFYTYINVYNENVKRNSWTFPLCIPEHIHVHWQAVYLETKHTLHSCLKLCSHNAVNIWDSRYKSAEITEKYHYCNHVKFYRKRNKNHKEPKFSLPTNNQSYQ